MKVPFNLVFVVKVSVNIYVNVQLPSFYYQIWFGFGSLSKHFKSRCGNIPQEGLHFFLRDLLQICKIPEKQRFYGIINVSCCKIRL